MFGISFCAGCVPGHKSNCIQLFFLLTKIPNKIKIQHSDVSSTPNASNCTNVGLNQSDTNNTSVHGVHSTTSSTHASTSSVASPSDVTST